MLLLLKKKKKTYIYPQFRTLGARFCSWCHVSNSHFWSSWSGTKLSLQDNLFACLGVGGTPESSLRGQIQVSCMQSMYAVLWAIFLVPAFLFLIITNTFSWMHLFVLFWGHTQWCSELILCSALRDSLLVGSRHHMGCHRLNQGWPCPRQIPYPSILALWPLGDIFPIEDQSHLASKKEKKQNSDQHDFKFQAQPLKQSASCYSI